MRKVYNKFDLDQEVVLSNGLIATILGYEVGLNGVRYTVKVKGPGLVTTFLHPESQLHESPDAYVEHQRREAATKREDAIKKANTAYTLDMEVIAKWEKHFSGR